MLLFKVIWRRKTLEAIHFNVFILAAFIIPWVLTLYQVMHALLWEGRSKQEFFFMENDKALVVGFVLHQGKTGTFQKCLKKVKVTPPSPYISPIIRTVIWDVGAPWNDLALSDTKHGFETWSLIPYSCQTYWLCWGGHFVLEFLFRDSFVQLEQNRFNDKTSNVVLTKVSGIWGHSYFTFIICAQNLTWWLLRGCTGGAYFEERDKCREGSVVAPCKIEGAPNSMGGVIEGEGTDTKDDRQTEKRWAGGNLRRAHAAGSGLAGNESRVVGPEQQLLQRAFMYVSSRVY